MTLSAQEVPNRPEPRGGRVVPVYALTGGRTRSDAGADMPVETLVTAAEDGVYAADLQLEYRATVELRRHPSPSSRSARRWACRSASPGCWSATW